MDAQDLDSPSRQTHPDPGQPPLTPATVSDPALLRAALQGRALDTSLGWYRLQKSWTELTVKALGNLANPGKGPHETIVDLPLWRARQCTQNQHIWIPPIEWGQALTHDTYTNVARRGTTHLRRAPAEKDRPADPSHPEQLEQATAPTRDTPLCAAGLCNPDDDLAPPPTDRDHPAPEIWCTVLQRRHYYVVSAAAASPGPQGVIKGTDTMLSPEAAAPGAIEDPIEPHKVLRGVPQPGDQAPALALAQITFGRVVYHLGLAMLYLSQWIKRCWPSKGALPLIWAIPTAHTQVPQGYNTPSPASTTPSI